MTEKLFEKDAYIKNFTAAVLSCEEKDGEWYAVLDKTAFFAEGGGQPSDTGRINDARVLDVQEKDGRIYHKTDKPVETGEGAVCEIDWDKRFDRMQNHAGEHIVAGIIHTLFGYNNVGFHLSDETMTADFDGPLSEEDIEKVELLANRAVFKNVPITVSFPAEEEFSKLDCRSKIDMCEGVRVVMIEGVDTCACCAPHPSRTGEIGIIKIISHIGYKGGVRLEIKAGERAFLDYSRLSASNKRLMGLLSAKRDEVEKAVVKQNEALSVLRGENSRLSGKLALSELSPVFVNGSAWALLHGVSYDGLRLCANSLTDNGTPVCVLLSETDDGFLYVVSSPDKDTRALVKELNTAFDGRGGGKPNWAQGKVLVGGEEKFRQFFEKYL